MENLILLQGLYKAAAIRDAQRQSDICNSLCAQGVSNSTQNKVLQMARAENNITDIANTIKSVMKANEFNN